MENTQTLHIIDSSSRGRAELSRIAFDLGYRAEVYTDVGELTERPLNSGLIIARDEPASGGIERFVRTLAEAGFWLPLVVMSAKLVVFVRCSQVQRSSGSGQLRTYSRAASSP